MFASPKQIIHWFSILAASYSWSTWDRSLSHMLSGRGQGTLWTGHLPITGSKYPRDKTSMVTFTPPVTLESLINLTSMF